MNADAEFVKAIKDAANDAADNMEGASHDLFLIAEARMNLAVELLHLLGIVYDPMTGCDK